MSVFSFSGKRPTDLGVMNGGLRPCPDGSQNCVSSSKAGSPNFVRPLVLFNSVSGSKDKLKAVLKKMSGVEVVKESNDYLHVECRSSFFGFVDDLEFYFDGKAKLVHVRSAARVGIEDFDVNRKRVEAIRRAYQG